MVVGDRLWLFSQTPNGPMHQSMVMPNASTMRPLIPPQAAQQILAAGGRPAYYNRHLMNSMPRLPTSVYSRGGMPGNFNPHMPFDARTHQPPLLPPHQLSHKDEYLNYQAKFMPHLTATAATTMTMTTSPPPLATGLADLEKAFGHRSDLLMGRRNYSVDCDGVSVASSNGGGVTNNDEKRVHKDSDTDSEIDCEQVDE